MTALKIDHGNCHLQIVFFFNDRLRPFFCNLSVYITS